MGGGGDHFNGHDGIESSGHHTTPLVLVRKRNGGNGEGNNNGEDTYLPRLRQEVKNIKT